MRILVSPEGNGAFLAQAHFPRTTALISGRAGVGVPFCVAMLAHTLSLFFRFTLEQLTESKERQQKGRRQAQQSR